MAPILCDRCEGYKLCSSHFPGSPKCRDLLREHGWTPTYTNADWIRSMSDEELAMVLGDTDFFTCPNPGEKCNGRTCVGCFLEWLKKPIKKRTLEKLASKMKLRRRNI